MPVVLNFEYLKNFINEEELQIIEPYVKLSHELLYEKKGVGHKFTGWIDLPTNYDKPEFEKIKTAAQKIISDSDVLVVIGVGGSYIGAKAGIEFLKSPNYNLLNKKIPKIFFVGNNLSGQHISEVLDFCKDKEISLNVISKSGETLEPAVAFRVFKNFMEKKYGKQQTKSRIYCTTSKCSGALNIIAKLENYETFTIPQNIGGRFAVLTAAGLLPIAVSGANIEVILKGAQQAQFDFENYSFNDCCKYAAIRNILHKKGKLIELITGYEPRLNSFFEWWKQLFGESEGKNQKGIFPASAIFTTDLHSLGQFIQDGSKILFETVLNVKNADSDIIIPNSKKNLDNLNFLFQKSFSYIQEKALLGVISAHVAGEVPNILFTINNFSEFEFGYLVYFFEKTCAISGYLLGVNPFNQDSVEIYKKNIFKNLNDTQIFPNNNPS